MRQPLTTTSAVLKYACEDCKAGEPCDHDCVESATCSVRCPKCGGRIWFLGSISDAPDTCECPYCKKAVTVCKT